MDCKLHFEAGRGVRTIFPGQRFLNSPCVELGVSD
jgi:hypothetical protein